MSDYLECPYCEGRNDIPDDCYEENDLHETECHNCGKVFGFYVNYYPSYSEVELPCRNGKPHLWKKRVGLPAEYFVNKFVCEYCDEKTTLEEKQVSDENK